MANKKLNNSRAKTNILNENEQITFTMNEYSINNFNYVNNYRNSSCDHRVLEGFHN